MTDLNRLLLCRVLLSDCAGSLAGHPLLYTAGDAVSELIAKLPRLHAEALSRGSTSDAPAPLLTNTDLDRIGPALPALLAGLQARLAAPADPSSVAVPSTDSTPPI